MLETQYIASEQYNSSGKTRKTWTPTDRLIAGRSIYLLKLNVLRGFHDATSVFFFFRTTKIAPDNASNAPKMESTEKCSGAIQVI